jgi:nucleoside-triphosphatase THEP1
MTENTSPGSSTAEVRAHLHTISGLLRHAQHLDPEAQALLADLVEEVVKLLESSQSPSSEVARITECASHLVQAVHQQQEPGVLESARNRLQRAVFAAENEAPTLAGITQRLVEMLSNVGI